MASMNVSGVGKTIGEWIVAENKIPSKLFLICMISVITISILKRSALIVGLPKVEVQNFHKNIDESQKDLLDNGKITQENFDKKQFHNQ